MPFAIEVSDSSWKTRQPFALNAGSGSPAGVSRAIAKSLFTPGP